MQVNDDKEKEEARRETERLRLEEEKRRNPPPPVPSPGPVQNGGGPASPGYNRYSVGAASSSCSLILAGTGTRAVEEVWGVQGVAAGLSRSSTVCRRGSQEPS